MIDPSNLPSIEEIELWRKANGISRIDLAKMMGVSHSMYEKWCAVKSNRDIPPHHQGVVQQLMKKVSVKPHPKSEEEKEVPLAVTIELTSEQIDAIAEAVATRLAAIQRIEGLQQ